MVSEYRTRRYVERTNDLIAAIPKWHPTRYYFSYPERCSKTGTNHLISYCMPRVHPSAMSGQQ